MPGSYSCLKYHVVFSTKRREPWITDEVSHRLYEYLGGIVRGEQGQLIEIGGMPDHVHLLIRWRTDATLADLMRAVKANSSAWIHQTFPKLREFTWQTGYGTFTVSQSQLSMVQNYIRRQAEHHRVKTFQTEYQEFLQRHEIEYDPRYLWD